MRVPILYFLAVGLSLLWLAWAAPAAPAEEFRHSFEGGRLDPQHFRRTGANAPRAMQAEAEGLRITMPADHGSKVPVGLVTGFGVQGDFAITMDFDILQVDTPATGYGAGVSIWITTVSSTQEAATIAWLVRPSGEQIFLSHRASTPAGGKRRHRGGKPLSAEAQSGKLRLVRKGATLSYQVAPGASDTFKEIYQTDLGTEDLNMVRFAGDNGGSPTLVDVRIKAVSIQAESFPGARAWVVPAPARWPLWLAGGLTVLLLAAGGYWLRSRHAQTKVPARDKDDQAPLRKPARKPSAVETSVRTAPPAPVLKARAPGPAVVPCPHCRKHLRVPASAVGKRVHCPACAVPFVA